MLRRVFGAPRSRRKAAEAAEAQRYVWRWSSVHELEDEAQAWRALAEDALEPNTVYCPNFLIDAFLELERKSWKGVAGTALACNEATRNFAYDAFGGADIVSRVRIRALTLDKRPIAMARSRKPRRRLCVQGSV